MSSPDRRSTTPSVIPQKRAVEDEHVPAVPSPLNPNPGKPKAAPAREQREKKESLKKREAKESNAARSGSGSAAGGSGSTNTPEPAGDSSSRTGASGGSGSGRKGGKKGQHAAKSALSLIRYQIPRPKPHDFEPPSEPVLLPGAVRAGRQFYETTEHVFNRKGFRYMNCIADPGFPFIQYHRQSDTRPFYSRFDYEDASSHVHLDQSALCVTTEKGFRMARANVCAREGRWYWECKVISGIRPGGANGDSAGNGGAGGGHVRIGFSRREASLETPVGFDAYSYGLRDAEGQKVHMSRPKELMSNGEEIQEGDVIGLEIDLPSLSLHEKVVQGSYNKAVDTPDANDPAVAAGHDIIRDRLPIRYKSRLYFEQFEYHSTKDLEDHMNPSPLATNVDKNGAAQAPHPNHPNVPMRTLPQSSIKIYKNGKYIGIPFTDLFAFLPPASKPANQGGSVVAREGLDDGMLGYFPSISVFRGGAIEANFGPNFWCPPSELASNVDVDMSGTGESVSSVRDQRRRLRPLSERYEEQIAEDIMYDIVDEVDLWATDDGKLDTTSAKAPTVLGPVDPSAPGMEAAAADAASVVGDVGAGEIKEVVQDDEE